MRGPAATICPRLNDRGLAAYLRQVSCDCGGVAHDCRITVKKDTVPNFEVQQSPYGVRCVDASRSMRFQYIAHVLCFQNPPRGQSAVHKNLRNIIKELVTQPNLSRGREAQL